MLLVSTVGEVSKSFKDLTVEIFENISKNMQNFPPKCYLFLCKTSKDALETKIERAKIFKENHNIGKLDIPNVVAISEASLYDYPEVIFQEDMIKLCLKTLEEYEGLYAHECGHIVDYFKNRKFSVRSYNSLIDFMVDRTKEDYEAEKIAIEAGYYTGCFSRQITTIIYQLNVPEELDLLKFMDSLSMASSYAAFLESEVPKPEQKEKLRKVWNFYAKTRKNNVIRNIFQSRELKECPKKFCDKRFLRDFITEKYLYLRKTIEI